MSMQSIQISEERSSRVSGSAPSRLPAPPPHGRFGPDPTQRWPLTHMAPASKSHWAIFHRSGPRMNSGADCDEILMRPHALRPQSTTAQCAFSYACRILYSQLGVGLYTAMAILMLFCRAQTRRASMPLQDARHKEQCSVSSNPKELLPAPCGQPRTMYSTPHPKQCYTADFG